MGRLILFALVVVAVVLVWKAFGPGTWRQGSGSASEAQASLRRGGRTRDGADTAYSSVKGPDDDEQFLWELDKKRFKERRAQEMREEKLREKKLREEAAERRRREQGGDAG